MTKKRKTKRASVLLRIDPSVAEWFQAAADQQGRSRTKLMAMWLAALKAAVLELEGAGGDPLDTFDELGHGLARRVIDLGMANAAIRASWEQRAAELRELVAESD